MLELLTPQQMAMADQLTIHGGVPGIDLMEAAGAFLACVSQKHFAERGKVLVVCGPGNNGGDGFVLARLLSEAELAVDIFAPLGTESYSGDAKTALDRLPSQFPFVDDPDWSQYGLIVDALFGAGLTKDIKGRLGEIVAKINESPAGVLAVDLPSGINGGTGAICGQAVVANVTATFFRRKPGHLLYPGRSHCGITEVGQIGIEGHVLREIDISTFHNTDQLWKPHFPMPQAEQHKYSRGHTLVLSGPVSKSGAARLMAMAALRTGSGLVTLACSSDVLPIHASRLDPVMFAEANDRQEFLRLIDNLRLDCLCMGPGMPPDETTRNYVADALTMHMDIVLDAGALSAFEGYQDMLFDRIASHSANVVITPHAGEFKRLFPDLADLPSRLEMARQAAAMMNGIVVLKGPDTVIADVDGRAAISSNAPPWLATAGSGDVLTGMTAGLLAQGMPAFYATCASVWIHGEAANIVGPGLISSDLDDGIRQVLRSLEQSSVGNK